MARFYGSMNNSRGNEVTAMGNKDGQGAHIRGWSAGVRVHAHPFYEDKGVDEFDIFMTGGSNGRSTTTLVGSVRETPEGPVFVPAKEA